MKRDQRDLSFRDIPDTPNDFFKGRRDETYMSSFEPSLTRQEFAEECDINTIMAKYEATGAVSHVNKHIPRYLDTTLYPDLQGAMDAFREATLQFNALPAKVRREFDNDPQQFVDFAVDEKNIDKMREWGLAAPPKPEEKPLRVEVVGPPLAPKAPGEPPEVKAGL